MKTITEVPKLTEKSYRTVDRTIETGGHVTDEARKKYRKLRRATIITVFLVRVRNEAGITQDTMAKRIGVPKKRITELESGDDTGLTLREISGYFQVAEGLK